MLAPWEQYFLDEIGDLPIDKYPAPDIDQEMKQKVFFSFRTVGCLIAL